MLSKRNPAHKEKSANPADANYIARDTKKKKKPKCFYDRIMDVSYGNRGSKRCVRGFITTIPFLFLYPVEISFLKQYFK
jgi:hypothetical protein